MATTTSTTQHGEHWKDRAIAKAETISDAFDVVKAYGAHVANWVLWFCLLANLIEMFQLPEPFATIFGNVVMGVQSISLDVAGFGLTSMGNTAKSRGDEKSAIKAAVMGWTLIGIMMLTVGLVAVSIMFPPTKGTIASIDKGLILLRILVTVVYGHIIHSLRHAREEHDNRIVTLEQQVSGLQNQVSNGQGALKLEQDRFAGLQKRFKDLEAQRETERDTAKATIDRLQGKLDLKTREMATMEEDQADTITLRRDFNAMKSQAEDLQVQLELKQQTLTREQNIIAQLRREVERLQQLETQPFHFNPVPSREVKHNNKQAETQQLKQGTILPFHQDTQESTPGAEDRKAFVIRLWKEDTSRSDDDIVTLSGVSKTSVWRYLKPLREQSKNTGEMPALTIETA